MALAMPLTMNTASSGRNPGRCQGSPSGVAAGPVPADKLTGSGHGARRQASQPSARARNSSAVVTGRPQACGLTAARITPARPSPSRQATTRLRWRASPPSMAPQDWCKTLKAL